MELDFNQGNIVVCELTGKIIETIPINKNTTGEYKIKWDIPPTIAGLYIYSIELDNIKVASDKIIISR